MSSFDETIEKLKGEIENHITTLKSSEAWAEVEKIYRALGTIEELAGTPKTSLTQLFGLADASGVAVKPGEFIGMDAVAAAKLYLDKKKAEAASLDEIMEAIQKGGAQTVSRDDLRMSLARSTWDVVKAPNQELYTLVKHTPHVKRGKKAKAVESPEDRASAESSDDTKKASA